MNASNKEVPAKAGEEATKEEVAHLEGWVVQATGRPPEEKVQDGSEPPAKPDHDLPKVHSEDV